MYVLVAAFVTCAFIAAWAVDRMANDLRDTGDPQYADPYRWEVSKRRFGLGYRMSSEISRKHRERFPASHLRVVARVFGIGAALAAVAFVLSVPRMR